MVLNAEWHDIFSSKEYVVSMIVEIMNGKIRKAKKLRGCLVYVFKHMFFSF